MESSSDQIKITGATTINVTDQIGWIIFAPELFLRWIPFYAAIFFATQFYFVGFTLDAIVAALSYLIFATVTLLVVTAVGRLIGFWRMSKPHKQIRYEIDMENVDTIDGCGIRIGLPWTQVKRIERRKPGYVLFMKPGGARWILKRAFSPVDFDAIYNFAKREAH